MFVYRVNFAFTLRIRLILIAQFGLKNLKNEVKAKFKKTKFAI